MGKAGENAPNQYQLNSFRAAQIFVSLPVRFGAATYLTTASDWLINLYLMLNSKGFSSRILRGGWKTCKKMESGSRMQFEMLKCQKVQSMWKCYSGNVTQGTFLWWQTAGMAA